MKFFFASSLFLASSAIVNAKIALEKKCDPETKATFGEWQRGFCVKSNGRDQNSGVIKLFGGDFRDSEKEQDKDQVAKCLEACACYDKAPVTGCEMIWDQGNRGCYVHTDRIARGNKVDRHSCYLATSPGAVAGSEGRVCTATMWGDPHVVSFDGRRFDAQAQGEALLIKTLGDDHGLEVQGRIELAGNMRGNPGVTTGVAVRGKDRERPIVQVSIPTYDENAHVEWREKQDGFCVRRDGGDQNHGVHKLKGGDWKANHEECLAECAKVPGVTGCEMIWDQGNRGCYAHTSEVARGNGVVRHSCYLPKKFGEGEKGYCIKHDGGDQNSGVIKLDGGDYTDFSHDPGHKKKIRDCLGRCGSWKGATGCEMIWKQGNKGCYVHTKEISRGNNVDRHSCYLATPPEENTRAELSEISFNGHTCPVEVLVNGVRQSSIGYEGGPVQVSNSGRRIKIEYQGEIGVEMEMSYYGRCFFSADFNLYNCDDRRDNTIGLLGSPDHNSNNDWMTRDNEILSIPDDASSFFFKPAFDYTKNNWILDNEEDSLFDHENEGFEEFSNPNQEYDPEFEVAINEAPPAIVNKCKGDMGCLIDGVSLGDEAVHEYNDNPASHRITTEEIAEELELEKLGGDKDDSELSLETSEPVEEKRDDPEVTESKDPKGPGSGSGDPHFKTWTGDKYDYHGECDLVLVDHPTFWNDKGLKVHIRTERVKYFSYISNIAVKIGDDVLEFNNDINNFLINGERVEERKKYVTTYLSGFHVRRDPKAISIRFDENFKAKIDLIQRTNGFPAVVVDGGKTELFKGSLGLLGDWETGKRLARDGETEMNDPDATAFALEWQVRDTEPMLFSEARFPQYPTTCTPPGKKLSNRLGMSNFKKEAEEACAHWKEDKEDCIFDVIASRDISVAAEGSITANAMVA